jgi:hypothetical protein
LIAGAVLAICGVALWTYGGGPMLLIAGTLAMITAALEPIYGRAGGRPRDGDWRPTEEKFIDPESGKLVTCGSIRRAASAATLRTIRPLQANDSAVT